MINSDLLDLHLGDTNIVNNSPARVQSEFETSTLKFHEKF